MKAVQSNRGAHWGRGMETTEHRARCRKMSEHAGTLSCQGAPQPQMPLLMMPSSDGERGGATSPPVCISWV